MPRPSTGEYPPYWDILAYCIKQAAGWRCVRCNHPHDTESGHMLTVHHLDLNKSNCAWWNLAALCQKCHLQIQAKIVMEQSFMFEHSDWFKPYAAGYYANQNDFPTDYDFVIKNMGKFLALGRVVSA